METENINPEDIFHTALEIEDKAKRAKYLNQRCRGNEKLYKEVESLLKAHEQAGDFLKTPPIDSNVTLDNSPIREGPGTKIGHYEILELIGEGGMGMVYLAQQKEPVRRKVVLKIVKPGMDSRQVIARFEAERQALAILDHPNIAHVFDAGTTETGRPYFAMEYVKGMSITRYCDEKKLNIEQRLRLFEQVCEAIHHAHQKGIIHRDIKPSNILISIHGDKAVPKIIDFGIAKAITQPLTNTTFVTYQGQLLGTPEYMSPEQVDTATQDIDIRSDIYSLGVVLYELLAGFLPYEEESFGRRGFSDIQRTIRDLEPASPSIKLTKLGERAKTIATSRSTQVVPLARRLQRELEWIPMKAMRKDRCRRYRSASEMADDVRNYLSGLPLIAGPETAIYRTKKFVQKHTGSVATVSLIAATLIIGLIVNYASLIRVSDAKKEAEQYAEKLSLINYDYTFKLAQEKYKNGTYRGAQEILDLCPEYLRGLEWYRLNYMLDLPVKTISENGEIFCLARSPDGKQLVAGAIDGILRLWDLNSGIELAPIQTSQVQEMVLNSQESRGISELNNAIRSVAFSPDNRFLVFVGHDMIIKVCNAITKKEIKTLTGHQPANNSTIIDSLNRILYSNFFLAFSSNGERLASCSGYDGEILIWDFQKGEAISKIYSDGTINLMDFSPDGKFVATDGENGVIIIWDAESGKLITTLDGHEGRVNSIKFSPNGEHIVSGSNDGTVRIWDTKTGKELKTLKGHTGEVTSVAYDINGKSIVSSGSDNTVRLWDATTNDEPLILRDQSIQNNASLINSLIPSDILPSSMLSSMLQPSSEAFFSLDGKKIISAKFGLSTHNGIIKIWDIPAYKEGLDLYIYPFANIPRIRYTNMDNFAFSSDSKHIFVLRSKVWELGGNINVNIRVYDTETGQEIKTFETANVVCADFSSDGKRLITCHLNGVIKVWDTVTGKELNAFQAENNTETYTWKVALSPDGTRIALAKLLRISSGSIKIFDAVTGKKLGTFDIMVSPIASIPGYQIMAFSPDNKHILTWGSGGTIKVWDAVKCKEIMNLHKNFVNMAMYSSDGSRIISGYQDGIIKVWDANTGDELMTLSGDNNQVVSICCSSDGRRLLSISSQNLSRGVEVRVWDLLTGVELTTLPTPSPVNSVTISPDGRKVAVADGLGGIIIWDTAKPAKGFEMRQIVREATELVNNLNEKHPFYKDVKTQLQTDNTIDESKRRIAIDIADSRLVEDDLRNTQEKE